MLKTVCMEVLDVKTAILNLNLRHQKYYLNKPTIPKMLLIYENVRFQTLIYNGINHSETETPKCYLMTHRS